MSLTEYRAICDKAKINRKNELPKISLECINYIESNIAHVKCLCNYIKISNLTNELLFTIVQKCKQLCNFCRFKNYSILYKNINELKYHQLRQIFTPENITESKEILDDIISTKINEMTQADLLHFVSIVQDININPSTVKKLLKSINYEGNWKKNMGFQIINELIVREKFIDKNNRLLTDFIMELMNKNKLHIFERNRLIPFFKSDYLLEHALITKNYDCAKDIINNSELIHVGSKHYDTVLWIYHDNFSQLCTKLTNLTELIAYQYKNYLADGAFDLIVNPSKMLETIGKIDTKKSYTNIVADLLSRKRPYIIYQSEAGSVGIDAGGLTRDFYTQFFIEVKEFFEEVDNHYIPRKDVLNDEQWRLIGYICGRSVLCEDISPSINLHPIICYFMLSDGYNVSYHDITVALKYFSLEYIENLMKLELFTEDEYKDFMELQNEKEVIPVKKYIMQIITQKYVNKNVINFVNGFRKITKSVLFSQYFNLVSFHKFVCGNEKYNIIRSNIHSLKNDLYITEQIDKTKEEPMGDLFKNVFLEILEEMNNNELGKLKSFLKYWFGTNSINSFAGKKSHVELVPYDYMYGCFKSSTCFHALYINRQKVVQHRHKMRELIIETINRSLENQSEVEKLGLHMQTA